LTLTSPAVNEGGALPVVYTCDGDSATLPLVWEDAPVGTQSFAVAMHHIPGPGDTHWYWVMYDIPATTLALPQNVHGVGTLGTNSVNGRAEYAPPCSKGPGEKVYTYTVYALSAQPHFTTTDVTRDVLLDAIADITLASAALNVTYNRSSGGTPTLTATVPAAETLIESDDPFSAFADRVTTHHDSDYLYIESDGMTDHPMMVGITSWQQQVPLPQDYTGDNAWQVPLNPVIADNPISAKTALYRGAIAIAVDGVPIFNALNNRGEDAYLAGELDEFGGHAGRADDYHYHIAPLYLEDVVGVGNPIAYALDGFPIYGSSEPDGSPMAALDDFNGHFAADGSYHYHGTDTYPYINGGMRGEVEIVNEQIEPQPHTTPIRDFLQPLPGAVVTGFEIVSPGSYELQYDLNGQTFHIHYAFAGASYTFEFIDPAGNTTTETYSQPQTNKPPK